MLPSAILCSVCHLSNATDKECLGPGPAGSVMDNKLQCVGALVLTYALARGPTLASPVLLPSPSASAQTTCAWR